MGTVKLGCVLAAALLSGGCFQMTTTIAVNGDGSGTIDHSMLVTKAALAQLRNFAALGGGRGVPAQVDLVSEEQARSMASALGPGVTYVSSEPLDTPLGLGRRATYSFTDISQVRISQQPRTDTLPVPPNMLDTQSGEITCTFSREANGNSVVRIHVPEMKPSELPLGAPRSPAPDGSANPAIGQQLPLIRALLAGARISIGLEPAGRLVTTNSRYVEGGRVTLLEVDLDQLLANEAVLARLQAAATPEAVKEALKDVPGLKIPLEREVTVEFTPAK
jgi:hypothetical protein